LAFLVAWLVRRLREQSATSFLHVFMDNPAIAFTSGSGSESAKPSVARCWRALMVD
jgi:hypothetical protein